MKLTVAAVTLAMFFVSAISQSTSVRRGDELQMTVASIIPVTAARSSPVTLASTSTTRVAIQRVHQPPLTIPEPWTTSPTTTTIQVVIASIETPVVSELEALICDSKWKWDCGEAIAVAQCESNMNPKAVSKPNTNGTIDRGLFQINDVWEQAWPPEVWDRILIARTNIAMAHHAWETGNNSWMYWTCQP